MDIKTIADRIRGYLSRKDACIEKISLDKEGIYEIISGDQDDMGRGRYSLGFYKGKYIDVLTMAVQNPELAGWWSSMDNMELSGHGYVVDVSSKIKEAPSAKNVAEYLKKSYAIDRKKSSLDKKLAALKNEKSSLERTLR